MTPRGFYLLTTAATLGGYAWLGVSLSAPGEEGWSGCLFRQMWGVPCPACGSTHALVALLQGHVAEALQLNPLAVVLAVLLAVVPVWLMADAVRRRPSLYALFCAIDRGLRRPAVWLPVGVAVLALWAWNVAKEMV